MILFYAKEDVKRINTDGTEEVIIPSGGIFATIDGRVHGEQQLQCSVNPGIQEENIGKYVIGWIENKEGRVSCNLDKFELLQKFEDITPESPLDYKVDVETGILIKKVV